MAGDAASDDPRRVRARAALSAAVVELAAERALDEISLAMVAERAGVSRSTAYAHAPSARALLEAVLTAEIDEIRRRHFEASDRVGVADAAAAATHDVALHVREHAAVYRRGLAWDAGASSLHAMLAAQFGRTVRMLLEAHDVDAGVSSGATGVIDDIVVRGIGDGSAGQLAAWILGPEPHDPAVFIAANAALLPPWWPRS